MESREQFDERFMLRALEMARATVGLASPNPQVGCVVVRAGEIVGEGAHLYDQRDHAEIVALRHARERIADLTGATVYVTLEPCSHHGRTGPCADALIAAGEVLPLAGVPFAIKDNIDLAGSPTTAAASKFSLPAAAAVSRASVICSAVGGCAAWISQPETLVCRPRAVMACSVITVLGADVPEGSAPASWITGLATHWPFGHG